PMPDRRSPRRPARPARPRRLLLAPRPPRQPRQARPRGMRCGSTLNAMRVLCRAAAVFLAFCAVGCKPEGTIQVHSLAFNGVKAVDTGRLKDALATRQRAKI